jgi:hypothetical protein
VAGTVSPKFLTTHSRAVGRIGSGNAWLRVNKRLSFDSVQGVCYFKYAYFACGCLRSFARHKP